MYQNLKKKGLGDFKAGSSDYYWSSSENGKDAASCQIFSDGSQDSYYGSSKGSIHYVRGVRAF
jgi:hypothetical protein